MSEFSCDVDKAGDAALQTSTPANIVISKCMAKSIRDSKKSKAKMGRPKTTGPGEPQVVRMHAKQIAEIDAWREDQEKDEMSRPEAIRRLVELGLKAKGK
jgi:hypothetical protein